MKCASRLRKDTDEEEEGFCFFIILPPRSGARFADFIRGDTQNLNAD